MGVKKFSVTNIGSVGLLDPEQMGYQDSVDIIKDESFKIQKSFVKIGWYLKHIRDNKLYAEDGYANIYECAADQFGYSQSTVSRFINICEKFSKDHNSPELDIRYAGFDKSQMIEMLPLDPDELEKVTPDMTVAQIREIKSDRKPKSSDSQSEDINVLGQTSIERDFPEYMPASDSSVSTAFPSEQEKVEPKDEENAASHSEADDIYEPEDTSEKVIDQLYDDNMKQTVTSISPLGYAKSKYPEGSLISSEGCGNRHDCFSCAQICEIRGVDRYCVEAPMGDPFPCMVLLDTDIKNLPDEKCQFVNHKIAYHRSGDNQPVPCCKECKEQCIHRCRRSVELGEYAGLPELPALKNNDQRKEWLANYKAWGLWYTDNHIDVNYYKFDFMDGSRLIVAEYPQRDQYWNNWKERQEDEVYYHLLEKNKKAYSYTYDEKYRHKEDSETYLVEFLKNIQKKG